MSLAVLDGGTFYHHSAIHGPRYRGLFDKTIYAPELDADALRGVTFLIVPDRINPDILRARRDVLIDFAQAGRTLAVLGENQADTWLPGVTWTARPTNFWWWLAKDAQPPHRLLAPEHEFFRAVPFATTIWHFHGVLTPPAGAQTLIDVPADPAGRDSGGRAVVRRPRDVARTADRGDARSILSSRQRLHAGHDQIPRWLPALGAADRRRLSHPRRWF